MKAHIGPIIKRIWILPFKNCLFVLTYTTINTTAYRLGLYKPTSPPTKELHGFGQPTIGRGMTVVGKGRKIFILKQRGHDIDLSHPRRDPIIMAIRRTNERNWSASFNLKKGFPPKKNISQSAIYQGMLVAESMKTLSPNDIGMTPL